MSDGQESEWLTELKHLADPSWVLLLDNPGGAVVLADQLPDTLPPDKVAQDGTTERQVWEWIGLYYRRAHSLLCLRPSRATGFGRGSEKSERGDYRFLVTSARG